MSFIEPINPDWGKLTSDDEAEFVLEEEEEDE